MNKYKALIVDAELNSAAIIAHIVDHYCIDVEVTARATEISEALLAINAHKPDILFLDIRLRNDDSFQLLDPLEHTKMQVIIITALSEYVTKTFKYNVVDYILKPLQGMEVLLAIEKAIKSIEKQQHLDFYK